MQIVGKQTNATYTREKLKEFRQNRLATSTHCANAACFWEHYFFGIPLIPILEKLVQTGKRELLIIVEDVDAAMATGTGQMGC